MGYFILALFVWFLLCLPALIYAMVVNGRRRQEARELGDKITSLTKELDQLRLRFEYAVKRGQVAPQTADASPVRTVTETPAVRPVAAPPPTPAQPVPPLEKLAPPVSKPVVSPPPPPSQPAAKTPELIAGIPIPPIRKEPQGVSNVIYAPVRLNFLLQLFYCAHR
jgi:hypothetical protein